MHKKRKVIVRDLMTGEEFEYPSMSEASRVLGFEDGYVCSVLTGKIPQPLKRGLHIRYLGDPQPSVIMNWNKPYSN